MIIMLGSFVVFRQIYLFVISRIINTEFWINFSKLDFARKCK